MRSVALSAISPQSLFSAADGPPDAEGLRLVGALFTDLRKALRLTVPEAAERLGTRIDVVIALEAGVVERLPPWPETRRLVERYTRLAGIDARPVLDVLAQAQTRDIPMIDVTPIPPRPHPAAGRIAPPPAAARFSPRRMAGAMFARPNARPERAAEGPAVAAGLVTGLLAWLPHTSGWRPSRGGLIKGAIAAAALMLAMSDSRLAGATASILPGPLAAVALGINDLALRAVSPRREGLLWIDAADPQARKGDKLHISRR